MKIFSNLKILFANGIRDLLVDIQPQIVIPIMKSKTDTTLETIKVDSLKEYFDNKNITLSLEFSLKHVVPNEKEPFDISNIFSFEPIKVNLIRYMKKTSEIIVYNDSVHKPKIITLPSGEKDLFGFRLYMSKYSFSFDFKRLRKGCQIISLYTYVTHEKRSISIEVREAIERLSYLLDVDLFKDAENYAFQFLITKSIVEDTTVVGETSVSTNKFKIIKSETDSFLTTQDVSPDNYYIPEYNMEAENSEQVDKSIKKNTGRCTIS